eukprot:TRINITY_DN9459_c2_g3_i1.p1 TRINITY_DN9459_c2_g3~~TRINITY_DN9459_c2_g3_i1.p1  ORF type:complete len:195 (-),score=45.77 TRINITY_DN9459_c2_g3_i1:354-938(-)
MRGTKRPVTSLADAFGTDEDQMAPTKGAKMSRNLGAQTATDPSQRGSSAANSQPPSYWQQQLAGMKPAESGRHDGASSILSTPVAGLNGADDEATPPPAPSKQSRPSQGNSSSSTSTVPQGGAASPPSAGLASRSSQQQQKASADLAAPAQPKVKGLFVCWFCKRRFDNSDVFDQHVLYSKLHQETIRQIAGLA